MEKKILEILKESLRVKNQSISNQIEQLTSGAELLAACIASGHKVLLFGNGGSAADAQHVAAEFVNRFQIERPPLAAMALTTDSSILTSIANDDDYTLVFEKQVRALGQPDDIAWGFSTSGNSENVISAIETAERAGLQTIGMTGRGGRLADTAGLVLRVESDITARIQETHITMGHILCELTERLLFNA
jgi:D-sedoheptulose 7-phosphate isomerase